MYNKRFTEKLVDEDWVRIEFMDLKKGDTFRLFEPDNEELVTSNGRSEFLAVSDPWLDEDGVGTIECDV